MKKLILGVSTLLITAFYNNANAQTEQGNWMVGASVANMKFTNGFNMNLTPKAGYFIKDNWALGAEVGLNVSSPQGTSATQTDWNVGAFTRYYLGETKGTVTNTGKFFMEGSAGFGGNNSSVGNTTNGVNLGIGAGYAHFITKNVGLEGLLKYQGLAGGGNNSTARNLFFGIGFQIYLPTSKVKEQINQ